MSNIVNWGHWLVGMLFAALGLDSLWHTVMKFPNLLHQYPGEITYVILNDAMFWGITLICAWGILKWRWWGRALGITLALLWVALGSWISIGFQSGIKPNFYWVLATLIACSVLVWFFVPRVRSEYSQRNQNA